MSTSAIIHVNAEGVLKKPFTILSYFEGCPDGIVSSVLETMKDKQFANLGYSDAEKQILGAGSFLVLLTVAMYRHVRGNCSVLKTGGLEIIDADTLEEITYKYIIELPEPSKLKMMYVKDLKIKVLYCDDGYNCDKLLFEGTIEQFLEFSKGFESCCC